MGGEVGRDLIEKALRDVRHGGEVDAVTREILRAAASGSP
jgi:hypothetical protein